MWCLHKSNLTQAVLAGVKVDWFLAFGSAAGLNLVGLAATGVGLGWTLCLVSDTGD